MGKDVGTMKVFYDIKAAERKGFFGPDPVFWGVDQSNLLIEMLTVALCAEGAAGTNGATIRRCGLATAFSFLRQPKARSLI